MTEHPPSPEPRPRDFSARMTRRGRARALGGARPRRHAGRRLAVLAAAIAVPAMATPGDWGPAGAPTEIAAAATPAGHLAGLRPAGIAPAAATALVASPSSALLDGGPAAPALRLAGSAIDRSRAQHCLTLAVYYEAAREPDAGQRAVAQVVLNRVAHPAYPDTVCGVVFQGSERTTGCQFSFTCDGALARAPAKAWWDRAARVARAALAGAVYAPVGLATHYHTLQIHPYWADSLDTVGAIGAHRFYRWRGAAGRAAAFVDRYRGGEPVAAPHPRQARPAADEADPLALARAYEASLPARPSAPAPVYSTEIEARGGDALFQASAAPAAGQVREEYARSGQWLKQP